MPPKDPRLILSNVPQGAETEDPAGKWFGMSDRILPFGMRLPTNYPSVPPALLQIEQDYFLPFARAVGQHAGADLIDERTFKRIRTEAKYKRLIMCMHMENLKIDQASGLFTWEGFKVYVGEYPVVRVVFQAHPGSHTATLLGMYVHENSRNDYTQIRLPPGPQVREQALQVLFAYFAKEGVLAKRTDLDEEG